jgi:hypothetical protein
VWAGALGTVHFGALNDLGLASVLSWRMLLAPALMTVGFCWALMQRPLRTSVLVFYAIGLVVILYATTSLLEPVVGSKVVWRHAGVVDHIVRTGQVDPSIDAYFNWPGFFVLAGFLTRAAGLDSVFGLARWAPLFFNLVALGPLLMLFRRATDDRRLAYLAVWVFLLANWVGQDYFAPQALNYVMYLVVLALLLNWFGAVPKAGAADRRQRVGAMALIIAVFAATVPSHQLTPFAILFATIALVAVRRCTARQLPVLMAVMLAALAFMAASFLNGHLEGMLREVGNLGGSATRNVGDRLRGSSQHLWVVRARSGLSAFVFLLAAAGWWRRRRRGYGDRAFAVLAIAPFSMLALQVYGGEMLMRAYLFGLPFAAFFAAAALLGPAGPRLSGRRATAVATVCIVLWGGFLFARYGNERADAFSRADVAAVRHLYKVAEPGALVMAASQNLPWRSERYTALRYRSVDQLDEPSDDPGLVAHSAVGTLRNRRYPAAYFIITPSQRVFQEALGQLPVGALEQIESTLETSPDFRLVYDQDGARIYQLHRKDTP